MSAIGPGDWVECLDASPTRPSGFAVPFVKGGLYLVAGVGRVPPGYVETGAPTLAIEGCPHPITGNAPGWNPKRFRPIYRPKADLIEGLLQPVDGVEPPCVPA